MSGQRLSDYKSNIDVDALKQARKQMTPEDKREQMVSGIFGLMDSDSEVTKEEIREELNKMYPRDE